MTGIKEEMYLSFLDSRVIAFIFLQETHLTEKLEKICLSSLGFQYVVGRE